jgi:FHA domain
VSGVVDPPVAGSGATPSAARPRGFGGLPFVHYRDGDGDLAVVTLPPVATALVVGRGSRADVVLAWDERVSRVHARLAPVGGDWTVEDDGLSRNGTWLNGERVRGLRRLTDRDVVQVGRTSLVFREPATTGDARTLEGSIPLTADAISPMQRRVLQELCRPTLEAGRVEPATTNEDIAGRIHLSVDAVKAHLRNLFRKFEIEELPQNQKRARLVRMAVEAGLVGRDPP